MEKNIYGLDKQYTVTEKGDVFAISKYDKKIMRPHKTHRGYLSLSFRRKGKNVVKFIHRLVAMAFVDGYRHGLQVNHKDGIKTNNNYLNLEWVTAKSNSLHARATGLYNNTGENHSMAKLTAEDVMQIRSLIKKGVGNYSRIAKWYKVNKTCIRKIATRETWKHITDNFKEANHGKM